MKKLIVPLLICIATIGTASADWKGVASTDAADFFLDKSTVRSSGQYKEAWVLTDLKAAKKDGFGKDYLSSKSKTRVDCVGDKSLYLALVLYSGNMGSGDVVFNKSYNDNDWQHIIPGSAWAIVTQAICGK